MVNINKVIYECVYKLNLITVYYVNIYINK